MRDLALSIVTIYGSFRTNGDRSVEMKWFLSMDRATFDQENLDSVQDYGVGPICIETAETFKGSNIHQKACFNENRPRMTESEEFEADYGDDDWQPATNIR